MRSKVRDCRSISLHMVAGVWDYL